MTQMLDVIEKMILVRGQALMLQGPPGPPPRPGLDWNPQSHRWVRPGGGGGGSAGGRGPKKDPVGDLMQLGQSFRDNISGQSRSLVGQSEDGRWQVSGLDGAPPTLMTGPEVRQTIASGTWEPQEGGSGGGR